MILAQILIPRFTSRSHCMVPSCIAASFYYAVIGLEVLHGRCGCWRQTSNFPTQTILCETKPYLLYNLCDEKELGTLEQIGIPHGSSTSTSFIHPTVENLISTNKIQASSPVNQLHSTFASKELQAWNETGPHSVVRPHHRGPTGHLRCLPDKNLRTRSGRITSGDAT